MKNSDLGIPDTLYRGDNFFRKEENLENTRCLKECMDKFQVSSNLILKGDPSEIYKPLHVLIYKHISVGWTKTHFISFTSKEDIARKYGLGYNKEYNKKTFDLKYRNSYDPKQCEFVIYHLKTNDIEFKEIDTGIYSGSYGSNNILLIDVVKALSNECDAKINATNDFEWLIFPMNKMNDGGGYESIINLPQGSIIEYFESD